MQTIIEGLSWSEVQIAKALRDNIFSCGPEAENVTREDGFAKMADP